MEGQAATIAGEASIPDPRLLEEKRIIEEAILKDEPFYPKSVRCTNVWKAWRCEINPGDIGQLKKVKYPSCTGQCKAVVSGRKSATEWNDDLAQYIVFTAENSPCAGSEAVEMRLRCKVIGANLDCDAVPASEAPVSRVETSKKARGRSTAEPAVFDFSGKDIVQCHGGSDKKFSCFVQKAPEGTQPGSKRYDVVSCGGACTSLTTFSKDGISTMFTTSVPGSAGKCSEAVKKGRDVLACMVARP